MPDSATAITQSIWHHTYYGNTVQQWAISLGIILGSFILAKTLYWLFSGLARRIAAKTETQIDDIVIDLVEEPIVASIVASGIWFSLSLLVLPKVLSGIISKSYSVLIWLLIGWMLCRLFDAFYRYVMLPWADSTENDLDDQLMPIIGKGVKIIVWVLAIVIGLNNAGYNVGALIAGLGIGGLALAMAAKDTVSNVFGGFTIFTDKPFRLGARIQVRGVDGTVSEIGIRSTRITTLAGRMVTMPNSTFADSPVENITVEPSRKIAMTLGLIYDTTPEKMQEALTTLRAIAEAHAATEEKILTGFSGFGDFSMNLLFIYYIKKGEDILGTQTDINLEVLRQFNEKGLEFAFPTQTLYNIDAKS